VADAARKLLIKPGDRVRVESAPGGFDAILGPLPDGARRTAEPGPDVVLVFVHDNAAFERAIPALRQHAHSARAAWIAYPKLSSSKAGNLGRDTIRGALDATDITTVTQVALDDTWSAIRLRPLDRVGRPGPRN
jgi:hypothetical protein